MHVEGCTERKMSVHIGNNILCIYMSYHNVSTPHQISVYFLLDHSTEHRQHNTRMYWKQCSALMEENQIQTEKHFRPL